MYQLVVLLGPNRGTHYDLNDGENSIGRQFDNTIVLESSKISKSHCKIKIYHEKVTVQDLGSANGTFVNGALVKEKSLRIKDQITVGEYLFELREVLVKELALSNSVNVFKSNLVLGGPSSVQSVDVGFEEKNQVPKTLIGKMLWIFEHQVMKFFYDLNLSYEWNVICFMIVGCFVLGNVFFSVAPVLQESQDLIIKESKLRAKFMARQIVNQNLAFIAAHNETQVDVSFMNNAENVVGALIIDLENRILAPSNRLNQYLTTGVEAVVAVEAKEKFLSGLETGFVVEAGDSLVVAVEPIKTFNPAVNKNNVVAMALVSIDMSMSVPSFGVLGTIYSESLIATAILCIVIFAIMYKLTLNPFKILNNDLDKALKGDIEQVSHAYKMQELNAIWDIINLLIQRSGKSNSLSSENDTSNFFDEVMGPVKMMGTLETIGVVAFAADKKILYLNPLFEEISGIRSESSLGQEMNQVARDQAFGSFVDDLLLRVATGNEGITEEFDFAGINYQVYAAAFGLANTTPKCFVLTMYKKNVT